MKTMSIETAERKRYRIMLWQTIGFGLFLGLMMFFPGDELFNASHLMEFLRGVGAGLGVAATVKLSHFGRQIKSGENISEAIGNELYKFYDRKALGVGFYAAIVSAFTLFVLEVAAVEIRFGAGIILDVGFMSARIAQLVYYRQ
ncbi:MAG: hypothetical protein LUE10_09445 [Alistipes sp.]|nr:hypothetical protein [Alistipes sp.]